MNQIEIETTYLASELPAGLESLPKKVIIDTYFPISSSNPKLRIRQNGSRYVLTKKTLVNPDDASTQKEENIVLSQDEFEALSAAKGKTVAKTRYVVAIGEYNAEIDVFMGELQGLVLVDVEFPSVQARDAFEKPAFCGIDVTQEDFIAGGMLAGKTLKDIDTDLQRLEYKLLDVDFLFN